MNFYGIKIKNKEIMFTVTIVSAVVTTNYDSIDFDKIV